MEHVAIMRKSWGLLPKIANGQKIIESRWLMNRSAPWDRVHRGDAVYFKDAGGPVTLRASVNRVLQFDNLTPQRIHEILALYGKDDGLSDADIPVFESLFRQKRYCVLVFLGDVESIAQFKISKQGFGNMAAWISVSSVQSIKL